MPPFKRKVVAFQRTKNYWNRANIPKDTAIWNFKICPDFLLDCLTGAIRTLLMDSWKKCVPEISSYLWFRTQISNRPISVLRESWAGRFLWVAGILGNLSWIFENPRQQCPKWDDFQSKLWMYRSQRSEGVERADFIFWQSSKYILVSFSKIHISKV